MNTDDRNQKFAIHAASREGNVQKFEHLLASDKRLALLRDDDDRLPLHWAASYNRLPLVDLLSESKGFDVDAKDGAGWTALMMAASLPDGDALVDLLLARGADPDEKTANGQTALHFAASKANLDVARKLVRKSKGCVRARDRRGQVPLHRAAAVGSTAVVGLLLEGGSPVNGADVDGCTPLHHAVAEGHGDTAVALIKAGAETDRRDGLGKLPIEGAPDAKVRGFILRAAEEEGIEVALK